MEKSKLGLSVGLFGAILYFIGAMGHSILILVLAAGYIMLFEQSEWLKKTVIKALILSIFFGILFILVNAIMMVVFLISNTVFNMRILRNEFQFNILNIISTLSHTLPQIIRAVEVIIFAAFGFAAYKQKDIKISFIDRIINREEEES